MTTLGKAAAVAGALTLAAVVAGVSRLDVKADPVERIVWDTRPAKVACDVVTVLDEKAGTYSLVHVCDADDGGKPFLPLDAGLVEVGQRIRSDAGTFRVEKVEHPCACSSGSDCESLQRDGGWARAPTGVTLGPGRWRNAGCFRKACVELWRSDVTSWPKECPGG